MHLHICLVDLDSSIGNYHTETIDVTTLFAATFSARIRRQKTTQTVSSVHPQCPFIIARLMTSGE